MVEFIIYILAFFITIPVIASIIIFITSVRRKGSKQKAVHTAVNWTTLFYIIAVGILFQVIFDIRVFSSVLILLIIVLAIILILQWKWHTEIILKKAVKLLTRISFLVFLFLYICLILIGMMERIFWS